MTVAQARALEMLMPRFSVATAALETITTQYPHSQPLLLEIGIGNGENLVSMAAARPHWNFLGCEVHRPGIGHALLEADAANLGNMRLLCSDAHDILAALPPAVLDSVSIFFPDPWPKKRHHKRRLVNAAFLTALGSRLRGNGMLFFASDNQDYAQAVRDLVEHLPGWSNPAGAGCWAPRPRWRVLTRFERRACKDGRAVYDIAACARPVCNAG